MSKYTRVFVHPKFKRKLKKLAADKDISMIKLTENLCQDDTNDVIGWKYQKKPKFNFRI